MFLGFFGKTTFFWQKIHCFPNNLKCLWMNIEIVIEHFVILAITFKKNSHFGHFLSGFWPCCEKNLATLFD